MALAQESPFFVRILLGLCLSLPPLAAEPA
jgi:hypothetical protein